MKGPLPAPPKRYELVDDLVETFDALALAGKKPTEKKLPDIPGPTRQPDRHQTTFIGGFRPDLLALNAPLDSRRRPPLAPSPSAVNQDARTAAPPEAKVLPTPPPNRIPMPVLITVPQTSKQSLTLQYALDSLRPNTPTKSAPAPPFVRPQPHSVSIVPPKVVSKSPPSASAGPSQSKLDVTPSRPRIVSVSSSVTSSSGRDRSQCSGMTKAGKQCSRQVKLPATHSHLDPTPVLYCHQHREAMITATQTGFYVRKAGNADRFVEFSHYIPKYLQEDTKLALRVEMEKATSAADVPGYIYTFEIRDPKQPDVIQLKVGRAVNLIKRLDQWDKKCGSKVQIPRGWWPGTIEDDDETSGCLLKGNIKAGDPGPFCHRVERLVHLELIDLSLHAPYLCQGWPDDTCDSAARSHKKTTAKETTCSDCGVVHREIFTFRRPEKGRYKGKEWDLIVKPVIEKWGKFVKEYYA